MELSFGDYIQAAGLCLQGLGCLTGLAVVAGLFAAFRQLAETRKALRGQAVTKLLDDWRSPEIYRSIRYIDNLRAEWKQRPGRPWDELAKEWVQDHVLKDPKSRDSKVRQQADEWAMRRSASQFLSKLGSLIEWGYLREDDFFGVNPEVGRQLAVLIPIEEQIRAYFANREKYLIADWDHPFAKWEFRQLSRRYNKWYARKGAQYSIPAGSWFTAPVTPQSDGDRPAA